MSSSLHHLKVFTTYPHECSYLLGKEATTLFVDPKQEVDQNLYTSLSRMGFRRSGQHMYKPNCASCQACVPARIPVADFMPSRNQRRVLKRNADLRVQSLATLEAREVYPLYEKYISARHRDGDMYPPTRDQFESFLLSTWAEPRCLELRLGPKLLGAAITDRLDDGLAAVYTYFDPEEKDRSLGTFAILNQLAWCRREALPYLYLGYWIRRADKMRYKHEYQPCELRIGERWVPLGGPKRPAP